MVHRIYVEKKAGFRNEAESLAADLKNTLGLNPACVRVINRYDVEGLSDELFEYVVSTVFSESPVDDTYRSLPDGGNAFAVCPLPGQFDLRAASAAQCISFISPSSSVKVRSAKVYLMEGLSSEETDRVKKYIINPVESMETSLGTVSSLDEDHPEAPDVPILEGFTSLSRAGLETFCSEYSLAMDADDLQCFQEYFRNEGREPGMSELRVCDTYWSDHCRHTTFFTALEDVTFADSRAEEMFARYLEMRKQLGITKPVTLMDIATIGAKYLKKEGMLDSLDESEEINACSIKIKASFSDGTQDDYLLMFKNETHNHPTEIEPFGGAATCIGGAIRDPLSGRAYVYQAMRISGSGNILESFDETMEGKLPQKKIGQTAAAGYSSYGNQIGLATGLVDEIYHPDYVAKHLELGAVVAAVRKENVRRERPVPGDIVILVGGRTGRDGIGGATGSSKSHKSTSVNTSGSEVQKGNAPEERKLQRLFRNPEASLLIKRCNDFGAGGVAVAIGELADGLEINLDLVKKKYTGLDGSEIAISESQERMAVVVAPEDKDKFLALAESENLEAAAVAIVTAEPVLVMKWRGKTIVSLRRSFLNTNGAKRKASAHVRQPGTCKADESDLVQALHSLKFCSRQGLAERFDSTIGAATVLMPYAGRWQRTPEDVMCALIPDENRRSTTASLFAYGFDPCRMKADPFEGAWHSVVTSVSKIVAAGGSRKGTYLSLQEFFGKTGKDREKWGLPLSALLGALKAQLDLSCAAIGGKDSMSGTFEDIDVPPTLVSFAINTAEGNSVISSALKKEKASIYLVCRKENEDIASYLDRVERMVERNKNHPCVIAWSIGNESGFGPNIEACADYLHKRDTSRFVNYFHAGTDACVDVVGMHYPSLEKIREFLAGETSGRPVLLEEYAHSMGNGTGNMREYWNLIETTPRLIGGFLWDWIDQGIERRTDDGRRWFARGGDFGDTPNDGAFCFNGIVAPERRIKPALMDLKHTFRPFVFEYRNGVLTVRNRYSFRNLNDFKTQINGTLFTLDCPPGETAEINLAKMDLTCETLDIYVFDRGYSVTEEQIPLHPRITVISPKPPLSPADKDDSVIRFGPFTFNAETGMLKRWTAGSAELLSEELRFQAWRAPTCNDRPFIEAWRKAGLARIAMRTDRVTVKDNRIITEQSSEPFSVKFLYTAMEQALDLACEVVPRSGLPCLPRIGIRLVMPPEFRMFSWYGRGPFETYRDRKLGAWFGDYARPVENLWYEYVSPQENGNLCDVSRAALRNKAGTGIRLHSSVPLETSVHFWTAEEIEQAEHSFDLPEISKVVWNIDHANAGVGNGSHGPGTLEKYRIPPEKTIFSIRLESLTET